jgi:hypothetical protein
MYSVKIDTKHVNITPRAKTASNVKLFMFTWWKYSVEEKLKRDNKAALNTLTTMLDKM